MGSLLLERCVQAGHEARFFELSPAAREKAVKLGGKDCRSPKDVAAGAECVFLFLPGPEEIQSCLLGDDGVLQGAAPGLVVVDMATSSPRNTAAMARAAAEKGVAYLDAPVLGRPIAVGNWCLPVGGDVDALDKARPILELVAGKIVPVGGNGNGHAIKLLNQMMFGAINAMTAEMMAVAKQAGVAPKLLYETIAASGAGTVSNLFKELGPRVVEDDYDNPTFSVSLLCKDINLAVGMAAAAGAPPLLGRAIQQLNEVALAQGWGPRDTSCMWRAVEKMWGK
jgi:3-hydroxyisobutyrate dehydrogenase-like beta-hydroxyacid dehydrogenase